jgi:hypothetical protein
MTLHKALEITKQFQEWRNDPNSELDLPKVCLKLTEAIDRILQVPDDIKSAYDTGAYDMGIYSEKYYKKIKNK